MFLGDYYLKKLFLFFIFSSLFLIKATASETDPCSLVQLQTIEAERRQCDRNTLQKRLLTSFYACRNRSVVCSETESELRTILYDSYRNFTS